MKKFVLLKFGDYQRLTQQAEESKPDTSSRIQKREGKDTTSPTTTEQSFDKEFVSEIIQDKEHKGQTEVLQLTKFLTFIPPAHRARATLLVTELGENGVGVAPDRSVTIDSVKIPNTHVIDVLKYFMKNTPTVSKFVPQGMDKIVAHLQKVNFPWSLVPNVRVQTPTVEAASLKPVESASKAPLVTAEKQKNKYTRPQLEGPIWLRPR